MNEVLTFYKNKGETPLQALDRLRLKRPELAEEKLSYAGRLDPMAEGLLLVLVGEANKEREKYLGLDKDYELEVLFGFSTDTHDILGKIDNYSESRPASLDISKALEACIGTRSRSYPRYSSKPVDGKPLFVHAREGSSVVIPEKMSSIFRADVESVSIISKEALAAFVYDSVLLVKGDFRQDDIVATWQRTLDEISSSDFVVADIRVTCSSGTYMRSLACEIGEKTGVPALALGIKRGRVGPYSI